MTCSLPYQIDKKIIRTTWKPYNEKVSISCMLSRDQSSEGLDYTRYKTDDGGSINFESKDGHILSLVEGSGTFLCGNPNKRLYVKAPLHIYIQKNFGAQLNLTGKCLVIQVS